MSDLGVSTEEMARRVGWRSLDTEEYYTQTKKITNMSSTATVLAGSTAASAMGEAPASRAAQVFRTNNKLRDFSSAFP